MSSRVLVHGIRAIYPVGFNAVVSAIRDYGYASNIYFTVLDTSPRIAIAFG